MLSLLGNYNGTLVINNIEYPSISAAKQALQGYVGTISIILNPENKKVAYSENKMTKSGTSDVYRIKVRQYMTKAPTPDFDFHDRWNGGIPMPLRTMVGRKLQETKGMVKMQLWGEITERTTNICMKCGRTLSNPVSRYFGIGPECGGHNYINPFDSETKLKEAIDIVQKQLKEICWTGWIIKSAIEEEVFIEAREVDN